MRSRQTVAGLVLAAVAVLMALAPQAMARASFSVGVAVPFYGPPIYGAPPPCHHHPPVIVAPPVYVAPPVMVVPPVHVPQGYIPPGYGPQGYAPQGYAPPGYPPSGYPPSGYPPSGPYLPPGFIAPPGFNATHGSPQAQAQYCEAGPYRCPMERPSTPGASCYCAGNQGQRVYGQVQ